MQSSNFQINMVCLAVFNIVWLPLFFLGFILVSCNKSNGCPGLKETKTIVFEYPKKSTASYDLDTSYTDVSKFLGFESWGSDVAKRYVRNGDTLTLSWTTSFGVITDDDIKKQSNWLA